MDCVLESLESQLCSPPVSPLGVVTDLVVQLHSKIIEKHKLKLLLQKSNKNYQHSKTGNKLRLYQCISIMEMIIKIIVGPIHIHGINLAIYGRDF